MSFHTVRVRAPWSITAVPVIGGMGNDSLVTERMSNRARLSRCATANRATALMVFPEDTKFTLACACAVRPDGDGAGDGVADCALAPFVEPKNSMASNNGTATTAVARRMVRLEAAIHFGRVTRPPPVRSGVAGPGSWRSP